MPIIANYRQLSQNIANYRHIAPTECRNFAAEKSSALMLPTVATTVTSDEKKITSDGTQFLTNKFILL